MILDEIMPGGKSKILIVAALMASVAMLAMLACSSGTGDRSDAANTNIVSDTNGAGGAGFVEIAAPIESLEIVKLAAKPPNASLVIVSGGLNSCESFRDYELSRDGQVFRVRVTNLRTAASNVPCTTVYGTQEHSILSASNEIAGCETYQVEVNGTMYTVEPSCSALVTGPSVGKRVEVLAPIVSAEVLALESFPVQYRLNIESALPNGCMEFEGYEVFREGETIKVTVTNLAPADKNVVCTDGYRTVKTTVSLGMGLDYQPATAYRVEVNEVSTGFVTDAAAPEPITTGPGLGEAFDLKIEETATIGLDGPSAGPTVELAEILEDSRCPSDVTCVWAGRALIRVVVTSPGDALGFGTVELILEAGDMGAEGNRVVGNNGSYLLTFIELAPYLISTVKLSTQDYVATLEVVKVPIGR